MKKIDFYIAKSIDLLQEAADLIQLEYEKDNYVSSLPSGMKAPISSYNKADSSTTFVAKCENIVIGTVTLVGDSEKGFPLDSIFRQEADSLRVPGNSIAEISQLAVRRDAAEILEIGKREVQAILLQLFSLVYYCAVAKNINILCITINPKHDVFYLGIGFAPMGEVKYYDTVNGAPALLRVLYLDTINDESNLIMRQIRSKSLDLSLFDVKQDSLLFSREIIQ